MLLVNVARTERSDLDGFISRLQRHAVQKVAILIVIMEHVVVLEISAAQINPTMRMRKEGT